MHSVRPAVRGSVCAHAAAAASDGWASEGKEVAAESEDMALAQPTPDLKDEVAMRKGDASLLTVQSPASVWLPFKEPAPRQRARAKWLSQLGVISGFVNQVARAATALMQLPSYIATVVVFKCQQAMLGNIFLKLLSVFVMGIPAIIIGGLMYAAASGHGIVEGCVKSYAALYKIPGVTVIGEVNHASEIVMNFIWLVGTFTFAIVLGVVSNDIITKIEELRSGNYPVETANHTLILNWNRHIVSLLRQIAVARAERAQGGLEGMFEGPVVILAERDKGEMDKELLVALKGYDLEWHTREGRAYSSIDLSKVAAGQARTIIVLAAEDNCSPAEKEVNTVLAIQAARASTKPRHFMRLMPQNIVVQAHESAANDSVAAAAKTVMAAASQRVSITHVDSQRSMTSIITQSAFQPGVASIVCSLVQQHDGTAEFYIRPCAELLGPGATTYGEARRRFPAAVVCGYVAKAAGQLHINPEDSAVVQAEDSLVALSPQTAKFAACAGPGPAECYATVPEPSPRQLALASAKRGNGTRWTALWSAQDQARHVVVLGWGGAMDDLAACTQLFAPDRSRITVVCEDKPENFPEERSEVAYDWVEGSPGSIGVLQQANVQEADAVVVGGAEGLSAREADAQTLSAIVLVMHFLIKAAEGDNGRKTPVHIVGILRLHETVRVANYLIGKLGKGLVTAELISPDENVSGMITQVAAEPDLGPLLSSFIYNSKGNRIQLRPAADYGIIDDTAAPTSSPDSKNGGNGGNGKEGVGTSFAAVAEAARRCGETAIGYITAAGVLQIAPHGALRHPYADGDKVVIVAEGSSIELATGAVHCLKSADEAFGHDSILQSVEGEDDEAATTSNYRLVVDCRPRTM